VIGSRFGRTVGALAIGVVLAGGVGACAKSVAGSAAPAANVPPAPATTSPAGGGGGSSTTQGAPPSGTTGDLSQQAQQTCALLPKDTAKSAFGVPDATVTAESGTTLTGGIQQVKCVLTSTNSFRANVVVLIYPPGMLTSADQYYQATQRQFSSVQKLNGISGADVAGLYQDKQNGTTVDEAFAAKKDATSNTVDVVIAGVADSPGITTKLVTFITALTNS
jgi:hypothetical protein